MKLKLITTLMVISHIVYGQTTVERFDSLFNYLHNNQLFNGNVLVAEKGKIIYQKSFGYADYATKTPLINESRFNIASVSKTFTSVAILQLKEKRKLRLDDKVQLYLPEFPYSNISIRNLITHTSGLPDYNLYETAIEANPNILISNKDVLPYLNKWTKPLDFQPGEKWDYSNTNFTLLALITEKISGLSFQNYLQKNIFAPAGMSNTYILEDYLHKRKDENRVTNQSYLKFYSDSLINVESIERFHWNNFCVSGLNGQGNIISTTNDLLKYDQSLYNGKLLKPETLKEAFTPARLNNGESAYTFMGALGKNAYGLGWFIFEDTAHGKIVWHTGGIPGSLSIFLRNISKQQTVILLHNTSANGTYMAGVNTMNMLNNLPVKPITKSLAQEYARTLAKHGGDAAFCRYIELQNDSLHYGKKRFEDEVNDCVFLELINDSSVLNTIDKSIDAFRLLVLLYPASWNTYDSYAYALEKKGMYKEAILMYKKSLELNPKNDNANVEIEKIKTKLK